MKTILAFAGSNSSNSVNKQLLNWTVTQIKGHKVRLVDINDYELPMFGEDLEKKEGQPEIAIEFRDLISKSDAFVIASPEHNGMMPAVLKNLFDWLSRVKVEDEKGIFNNKPVLLLSTSPGPRGGQTNLQNMANVMPYWGADIKGQYSLGGFYQEFADSQLSGEHASTIKTLLNKFSQSI